MQLNKASAEKRLEELNMGDMPIIEIQPMPSCVKSDWFTTYKKICREFMESLSDSIEEIALMNLNQDEFMALITGHKKPQNVSIRFRIPLMWGGKLEPSNLFMCWTFPQSQKLDKFIIEQTGAKTIWLPNPTKKVYVSIHNVSGGDGGNATADRLSQLAAQIVAARGMEQ